MNWSFVQPVNGTGNSTHVCYYCNFSMQLKNTSASRPFYATVEIAPWLKYSSIPQAILDKMGLTGIAYGVVVYGNVSYSAQIQTVLYASGLVALGYGLANTLRRTKKVKEK